jgi:3-isopropylmalate/(R)-2-methylmalate dehydratase small subunit
MDKVKIIAGVAVPLRRANVDTDQIIPSRFLKRITRSGYDDGLFAEWRKDPKFVLNQEAYSSSVILVAGADFGTGSSREHAVWALRDYGFRAVISSRFADIFRTNAGKQGLVAAQVTPEAAELLLSSIEANPGLEIRVDLVETLIFINDEQIQFQIDNYTRWRLLNGLDDISLTEMSAGDIDRFELSRPSWAPRIDK